MLAASAAVIAERAAAQEPPLRVTGQLIASWTRFDPVPFDSALAELRVVQPVVMLRAVTGRLRFLATLNLEGATMEGGELGPGTWGEGFMDRRHPHTYAHELMIIAGTAPGSRWRAGIAAGKGFVPFGTDDPMSRPPLRYPVNHHFSQILERAVVQASGGTGPLTLELATFNGDEPENPSQWPNFERFGDSWSARLTAIPLPGLEVQGSYARVRSPEHREGAGSDQDKWSGSARWERSHGKTPLYGLLEWAHTSELDGFFAFDSWLFEGAVTLGRHQPYARLERTERPEEQRLVDPFRSQRPHTDNSILGITRWTVVTAGYRLEGPGGRIRVWPIVEVSYANVSTVTGLTFDPVDFYGSSGLWAVSLGVRFDAGMLGHRMGRYGVFPESPHSH